MKTIKYIFLSTIIASLLFSACGEDYLEVTPTATITSDRLKELGSESQEAFIEVVQPLVTGLYSWLIQYNSMNLSSLRHSDFGHLSVMLSTDLMNEDMLQNTSNYGWFYSNYDFTLRTNYTHVDVFMPWNYYYKLIKSTNDIFMLYNDEIDNPTLLVLKGQAFAMRGFAYLYLVQLYQHTYVGHESDPSVPLVTDLTPEAQLTNNPRAEVSKVYEQILSDLTQSYELLENFQRSSKVEVDKQVVAGLLARTYLNMENWSEAAKYAHIAREGYTPSTAQWDYINGTGFLDINEPDWMWGADVNSQTRIATSGIVNPTSHLSSVSYGYATAGNMEKLIDKRLYDQIPESDLRKNAFNGQDTAFVLCYTGSTRKLSPYANLKFGFYAQRSADNFGDYAFMRASEMYLIEAEALAMNNNNAEAQNLLYEFVRTRDPLAVKSTATGTALRNEVYLQRRIELWGEGFSYFDHKRLKLGVTRNYPETNHRQDAMINFDAEDSRYRFVIPRQEIINNNGISEKDNND